jgi:hypothetical protein
MMPKSEDQTKVFLALDYEIYKMIQKLLSR